MKRPPLTTDTWRHTQYLLVRKGILHNFSLKKATEDMQLTLENILRVISLLCQIHKELFKIMIQK